MPGWRCTQNPMLLSMLGPWLGHCKAWTGSRGKAVPPHSGRSSQDGPSNLQNHSCSGAWLSAGQTRAPAQVRPQDSACLPSHSLPDHPGPGPRGARGSLGYPEPVGPDWGSCAAPEGEGKARVGPATSAKAPRPHSAGHGDGWTHQPPALSGSLRARKSTSKWRQRLALGWPGGPAVPAERELPPPALNKEPFAGPEAPARARLLPAESAGCFPLFAIHLESREARQRGGDPYSAQGLLCTTAEPHRAPAALPLQLRGLQTVPTWWGSHPPPARAASALPPFFSGPRVG